MPFRKQKKLVVTQEESGCCLSRFSVVLLVVVSWLCEVGSVGLCVLLPVGTRVP
jgi:hypothetical protein